MLTGLSFPDAAIKADGYSTGNTSDDHCAGGSSGGLIRLRGNRVNAKKGNNNKDKCIIRNMIHATWFLKKVFFLFDLRCKNIFVSGL